ncbi:hypothetical protein GCM10022206_89930 [Streptomyces chiangmaiensis]
MGTRREVGAPSGDLRAEEVPHLCDPSGDGLEGLCPAGFDDLIQRSWCHGCHPTAGHTAAINRWPEGDRE